MSFWFQIKAYVDGKHIGKTVLRTEKPVLCAQARTVDGERDRSHFYNLHRLGVYEQVRQPGRRFRSRRLGVGLELSEVSLVHEHDPLSLASECRVQELARE